MTQVNKVIKHGGHLYVAGSFTGAPDDYLVKINATTGVIDAAWDPMLDGPVMCMELSTDGTILYIGGAFTTAGGASRNYLAAINTSNAMATTWNPSPDFVVNFMTRSSDNTIFIAGDFTSVKDSVGNVFTRNGMAAIRATGGVTSFNPKPDTVSPLRDLSISTDDKIILVAQGNGSIFYNTFTLRRHFAALDAVTGTPLTWDPNFPTGNGVFDIEVSGTTMYLCGSFNFLDGGTTTRTKVAKFVNVSSSTTPALDATFVPPTNLASVRAISYDNTNDKLYCLGDSYKISTTLQSHFFILDGTNASLMSGFNMGANNYTNSIGTKIWVDVADNKVYIWGTNSGYSLLGEKERYWHVIDLTGNAITAKANAEVATATGTVTYVLNTPENSAMIYEVTDPTAGAHPYLFGDRYMSPPQNVTGVTETNILPYRFILHVLTFSKTSAVLKFKLSDIPGHGLTNPASTAIYYRSTPSENSFTSAGTVTYNSVDETLEINANTISNLNEFIFATNDPIALPIVDINFHGYSTYQSNVLLWQLSSQHQNDFITYEIEKESGNNQFLRISNGTIDKNKTNYEYVDKTITNTPCTYRIRFNDKNGRYVYSKTITLQVED
ncbi:MAG: hypothetical protein RML38_11550, partial [Bacteroidia bacterium]|nr:hypothetical protein [Bacteroidia bacterium]